VLHWLLVGAALAYVAFQAPALVRSALAGGGRLDHVRWEWVVASAVLGLAAVAIYAELHRQLLAVGGARLPRGIVQSITFTENAIATTVPVVGGAGSLAYAISRFRRRGVDSALAAWAVLLAGVLDTLALFALAAIALAATGRITVPLAVLVVVMVAAGAVGAWAVMTHPAVMRALLRPLLWLGRFVPSRCPECRSRRVADLNGRTNRVAARLTMLRPSARQWSSLLAVTVFSWLIDFANLAASAAGALEQMPWPALVVGFLLVQASIAVQVLPGGAGLAEVGLLGTLLAAGAAPGPAALTVLIYRSSSWLLPAAAGWVAYGVHVHVLRPRRRHHPPHEPQPSADDLTTGRELAGEHRPASAPRR
jgi:putative heme transporter